MAERGARARPLAVEASSGVRHFFSPAVQFSTIVNGSERCAVGERATRNFCPSADAT